MDILKIAGESQKRKGDKARKSEHAILKEMGKMHFGAQENGLACKTGELRDKGVGKLQGRLVGVPSLTFPSFEVVK